MQSLESRKFTEESRFCRSSSACPNSRQIFLQRKTHSLCERTGAKSGNIFAQRVAPQTGGTYFHVEKASVCSHFVRYCVCVFRASSSDSLRWQNLVGLCEGSRRRQHGRPRDRQCRAAKGRGLHRRSTESGRSSTCGD